MKRYYKAFSISYGLAFLAGVFLAMAKTKGEVFLLVALVLFLIAIVKSLMVWQKRHSVIHCAFLLFILQKYNILMKNRRQVEKRGKIRYNE